jgi:hypothetical protein
VIEIENSKPRLFRAARTRTLLSCTAVSGNPTMMKFVIPRGCNELHGVTNTVKADDCARIFYDRA